MATETIAIPLEEYEHLKKKEVVADDILLQMRLSLQDFENGRMRRVR